MNNLNEVLNDCLAKEIISGVDQTFSSMLGIKPQPMPHSIVDECRLDGDVTGLISVIGPDVNGTLILTFPKDTISVMLEKIYRKKLDPLSPAVKAGVGEITNIVFGLIKTNLNKRGFGIKMAIPNVILGEQHTVISLGTGPVLMLPFNTEKGHFAVMIGLHDGDPEKHEYIKK